MILSNFYKTLIFFYLCKNEDMKYYFQRKINNITALKLYSYELVIIGIVSIVFYCVGDTPKVQLIAKMLIGVSFGLCAIVSAIDVYQEARNEDTCNVYDLLRVIVSCLLCVMSFTCIDVILG